MILKTFIKSKIFKDFSLIFIILGITTLVFHVTNFDIACQEYFYSHEKGWIIQYLPFWDFIYQFGIFPGYFFALAGLIMISVSYWNVNYIKYRKASIILVFTLFLGPGFLVNFVFKDHWGRPRPYDLKEFGGKETFIAVGIKGPSTEGKSFPCGHASMGFFIAVPYLFFRNRKKKLAYAFLATGLIYGGIIGLARIMAGGHFLSDVIWAGGLVWIAALIGYYLFKFDKQESYSTANVQTKKTARWVTVLVGIIMPVMTLALILATPYISKKTLVIENHVLIKSNSKAIVANVLNATVDIKNDTCFQANYKVHAFGFPNSKIRGSWTAGDTCKYDIQEMGWFTEVTNSIEMKLPMLSKRFYSVVVNKGKIFCSLADSSVCEFNLKVVSGEIHIQPNKNKLILIGDESKIRNLNSVKIEVFKTKPTDFKGIILKFDITKGTLYLE